MSYTTLNQINTSFNNAVTAVYGLDSYLMIDISELNGYHNLNYPLCIIEPPNSSVSNINKAWEDYEISCYILQIDDSDTPNVEQYDTCTHLFSTLLTKLMKQQEGVYSFDKESVSVERVRDIGNDKLIGIKASFNILMPSILIGGYEVTDSLAAQNLYSYFDAASGAVTIGWSSISWASSSSDTKTLVHTPHYNTNGAYNPTFSSLYKEFIFDSRGLGVVGSGETLLLEDVTFTNKNFSIFLKVKIPSPTTTYDHQIFSFPKAPFTPDYMALKYIGVDTHGGDTGRLQLQTGDGYFFVASPHTTPFGDAENYVILGVVNNYSDTKTIVYVGNSAYETDMVTDETITDADLHIGAAHSPYGDFSGLNGSLRSVAIYDEAVTDSKAQSIINYLNAN